MKHFGRMADASLAAAATLVLASNIAVAQRTGPCQGRLDCFEAATFVATVTDFRVSGGATKIVTANVRFLNRASRPLILGYVAGSGIVTDDQGNRYQVEGQNAVRGIGEISGNAFEAKFALEPNEASDARFEFAFRPRNEILGTTYDIELTVREINPLPANQFRLGKEYALSFKGFGGTKAAAAAVSGTTPLSAAPVAAGGVAAPAPPAAVNACGETPRCYDAGKFAASVSNILVSERAFNNGSMIDKTVQLNIKFRNVSSQPIILAYRNESGQLTDDAGNRYRSEEARVRGMGVIGRNSADPQFVLAPGESRDATFESKLTKTDGKWGSVFSYDLTLEELEVLPSQQVRSKRAYAVGFTEIKPTTKDKAKGFLDALKPKVTIGKP